MREAVVVASSRTPLAKSFRGSFNLTRPDDLAAHCIRDALGKVPQLDPAEIEDVILGCAQPHGPQGTNVARVAAIDLFDDRRERRRLPRSGGSAQQDETARQIREQLNAWRQPQRRESGHAWGQRPQRGDGPVLRAQVRQG